MEQVYLHTIGAEIILDTGYDLSAATVDFLHIYYKNPFESGYWVGEVFETTKVRFVTNSTHLNQVGKWYVQARVSLTAPILFIGYTSLGSFDVLAPIV